MKAYDIAPFAAALDYQPRTGAVVWRAGPRAGRRAGYVTSRGYRHVTVAGQEVPVHRLAWALTHGEWPDGLIDHRNGDRADNRLSNLRLCDQSGNAQNTPARNRNGKLRGVHKSTGARRYSARIVARRRCVHLGYFDTPEEAHAAYLAAKRLLHTFQPTPRAESRSPFLVGE